MGHLQPTTIGALNLDTVAAEQNQIQIQFTRAPPLPLLAPECLFQPFERGEESQCTGLRIGPRRHVQGDRCVQEIRLFDLAHWTRSVQPGHAADPCARQGVKGTYSAFERGARVANVRAEPDVSADSVAQPRLGRGMAMVTVLIFHCPANTGEPELVRLLASVRDELTARHAEVFRSAGATEVRFVDEWHENLAFGEVLAKLAPARGGVIVLSGGAVPLLNRSDAIRLVDVAGADGPQALTNNRYSSDVCAVAQARTLRRLPPLPTDNALPRWLEERAGYSVEELGARRRLGLDLDTPQDVALAALAPQAPAWLRGAARAAHLAIPRRDDLRALADDPHAELLIFGRSGSATLRWLENNVRCRVRFLAEERGLRASTPLAIGGSGAPRVQRGPRATLGLLLTERGADNLATTVAELADGAIIDSRVLLAHHLGADESSWPPPADRFASDLQRANEISDPWLKALTESAASGQLPILLGGHSLVGPGIPLLLRRAA